MPRSIGRRNTSQPIEDLEDLWVICKKFVDEHQILCAESIDQMDEIQFNAPDLIQAICDKVGYYEGDGQDLITDGEH